MGENTSASAPRDPLQRRRVVYVMSSADCTRRELHSTALYSTVQYSTDAACLSMIVTSFEGGEIFVRDIRLPKMSTCMLCHHLIRRGGRLCKVYRCTQNICSVSDLLLILGKKTKNTAKNMTIHNCFIIQSTQSTPPRATVFYTCMGLQSRVL